MTNPTAPPSVRPILARAIESRVFPGAVVEVGRTNGSLATIVAGTHTYDRRSPTVEPHTIYDLASLTKVIATTALMAGEIDSGRMRLTDRVRHWVAAWTGEDRQSVTLQDLLEHASGLPAHRHSGQAQILVDRLGERVLAGRVYDVVGHKAVP